MAKMEIGACGAYVSQASFLDENPFPSVFFFSPNPPDAVRLGYLEANPYPTITPGLAFP